MLKNLVRMNCQRLLGRPKPMSTLSGSLRLIKKKKSPLMAKTSKDSWSVVGYSTADDYNLVTLEQKINKQGLYIPVELSDDLDSSCLCVKSAYDSTSEDQSNDHLSHKEIFFFSDGSTVFWNVPHLERENVLQFLRSNQDQIELNPFDVNTIEEESEMLLYAGSESGQSTHFSKGMIKLSSEELPETQVLQKYTFSNAIATSVKLGMLEAKLDRLIDSIEFVTADLKSSGKIHMTQEEVLKKSGELFSLRSEINLSLNLLDTPDFYWDRENLENLYHVTCAHLSIKKRTAVMNEKLSHLCELMALLTTHLTDKHHVRLEWFIIVLIMIEVVFELMHFIERYF